MKQSGGLLLLSAFGHSNLDSLQLKNSAKPVSSKSICTTCGTEFPTEGSLPLLCPICDDDRQYITDVGQQWTSLEEIDRQYNLKVTKTTENVYELKMTPDFAIGQRAFFLQSAGGNILWDCIPLINESVIKFIKQKGGLKAIVISHPHYYSTMNRWAELFNCPIYIHAKDERWIMYRSDKINLWSGNELSLWDGIKAHNIGGHFPGSSVLHLPWDSVKGMLLCGDSLYIARSKKHVAVMHSYPNQIMLTKQEFIAFNNNLSNLQFDTMHGAFEGQNLVGDSQQLVLKSMKRYKESYEI